MAWFMALGYQTTMMPTLCRQLGRMMDNDNEQCGDVIVDADGTALATSMLPWPQYLNWIAYSLIGMFMVPLISGCLFAVIAYCAFRPSCERSLDYVLSFVRWVAKIIVPICTALLALSLFTLAMYSLHVYDVNGGDIGTLTAVVIGSTAVIAVISIMMTIIGIAPFAFMALIPLSLVMMFAYFLCFAVQAAVFDSHDSHVNWRQCLLRFAIAWPVVWSFRTL